jgi:uncharacterized protein (TIGR02996 family)
VGQLTMSDGELLLRAILDQPKEDTPRLVYADWCDENGQPERAEFIRVQVTIARWGTTPPADAEEWVRRERELIYGKVDSYRYNWHVWISLRTFSLNYPSQETIGSPSVAFSRGFVSHVSCSWPDWRAHADAILAAQPVERVRLTDYPMAPAIREVGWSGSGTVERWLKARWPRIEFELPPERGEVGGRRATMTFFDEYQSLREWWENLTQAPQ